jgi:RimJ/RimL family protein N-acetyltransferase
MLPLPIPVLEAERLRLRGWQNEDQAPFADYCADAMTERFLGGPGYPADAWRRMAAQVGHWVMRGYGSWALEEKASGRWVGYCGLWNPHGWPEPEVMWGLAPSGRGLGYATEAAGAVRDYAYRQLGWTTLISCIAPDNIASQRVAERLGATLEKTFEHRGQTLRIYRHPAPSTLSHPSI